MINTMGKKKSKVEQGKGEGKCWQKGGRFQIGWSRSRSLIKDLQEVESELCRFPSRGDTRRAGDCRGMSEGQGVTAGNVRERGSDHGRPW